jgi:hypothetical protein
VDRPTLTFSFSSPFINKTLRSLLSSIRAKVRLSIVSLCTMPFSQESLRNTIVRLHLLDFHVQRDINSRLEVKESSMSYAGLNKMLDFLSTFVSNILRILSKLHSLFLSIASLSIMRSPNFFLGILWSDLSMIYEVLFAIV